MKLISILFLANLFLGLKCLAGEVEEREPDLPLNQKEYWLFVGNPGVGKSTLINALMKKVVAEADVSAGVGLTQIFASYEDETNNRFYLDTPGLATTDKKKMAAEEIEKALSQDGIYKIFFVLNLRAGRITGEDVATINAIMKSINLYRKSFSVIINKMTVKEKKKFKNEAEQALLYAALNSGEHKTDQIYYIDNNTEMDNEDIQLLPLSQELHEFLTTVSAIHIEKDKLIRIQVEELDKIIENHKNTIDNLTKQHTANIEAKEEMIENLENAKKNHKLWHHCSIS